ncbi:MAG: permease-like cell division protein FtsX [Flavobacteriales bacterium]|jgi:cell division transport system permease protein|nr:permease-like cell division protein FtsX [Flavobacteriales bacterium]
MSGSFEKYQKRRLISSYFSVVISVALVLFLLGFLGVFMIQSKKLIANFKEQVPVTVFLNKEVTKAEIQELDKYLSVKKYIKKREYVSAETAASKHTDIVGEDFMEFLGFNPLEDSFDIELQADYVQMDSIYKIEKELKSFSFVSDVFYDKNLVDLVHENIQKITFWMLVLAGILTVVAILLINSSMRLSIYANRFIIKTMQMVGATKSFIRKPFIWKNIRLGIAGALLAILSLTLLLFYLNEEFPELELLQDPLMIGLVMVGVLVVGILIAWISTFFATQRYLNLKTDDLY